MNEKIKLLKSDALLLDEMAEKLRALEWEISACSGTGELELKQIREFAPQVLKAMVSYI